MADQAVSGPSRADDLVALLDAATYRDFLRNAFERRASGRQRFSYAGFARRAGFAARSFPREVVLGHKRLTAASAARFADALGLRGDVKAYFLALVAAEEDSRASPAGASRRDGRRSLERMRQRLRARAAAAHDGAGPDFYGAIHWLEVYAALGSQEGGAELADVARRTGLAPAACEAALAGMAARKVVRRDAAAGRYFAVEPHLVFERLGADANFKQFYLGALVQARQQAAAEFAAGDALFFNSFLCVRRADMPRFKAELRDLLTGFVDAAERAGGDAVARLTVAFYAK